MTDIANRSVNGSVTVEETLNRLWVPQRNAVILG